MYYVISGFSIAIVLSITTNAMHIFIPITQALALIATFPLSHE
jgi:hypothetical protein